MNLSDTISAIATPVGEGGIGIIRISGADAEKIAGAIFKPHKNPPLPPFEKWGIKGAVTTEDIFDRIFSHFCIGK